jgi:hypothetical protein
VLGAICVGGASFSLASVGARIPCFVLVQVFLASIYGWTIQREQTQAHTSAKLMESPGSQNVIFFQGHY